MSGAINVLYDPNFLTVANQRSLLAAELQALAGELQDKREDLGANGVRFTVVGPKTEGSAAADVDVIWDDDVHLHAIKLKQWAEKIAKEVHRAANTSLTVVVRMRLFNAKAYGTFKFKY